MDAKLSVATLNLLLYSEVYFYMSVIYLGIYKYESYTKERRAIIFTRQNY